MIIMIIKGANLGEKNVKYSNLSEYEWTNNPKLIEIIKKLEFLYLSIEEQLKNQIVNPMIIDDSGIVDIPKHSLNHRCSNSMESIREISKHGILASEWFGELESEREGCFCVFVSRMKGDNYPYHGDLAEDDKSRLSIGRNIILFFDDENPLMKYLLHLDYFEFEHQKQDNPDYCSLYTPDELEILEQLIEPLSPAGKGMRKPYDFKTNYWSAIPGGIPAELVNGICVKNNNYSESELDEISYLFPNAVLFDSCKKVLRYPLVSQTEKAHTTFRK